MGAGTVGAEDRIVYNSATGALLFDRNGAGGTAAVQFAVLDPRLSSAVLGASDFSIIV